ncbi:site-specific integrase [Nocardia puris]|uniref:tyrosine-type recombinase/integrase n=1 Tax=Nocardia puris TaxID=208602 RepID=UPI001893EFE5|nr:site-specific integrase [Nocardia puris]MBF6463070.1 site-specific integrase [Nocardia puris]
MATTSAGANSPQSVPFPAFLAADRSTPTRAKSSDPQARPVNRRNRRAGVEDLWTKDERQQDGTIRRVPSKLHGKGKRWRARYVDDTGNEHTKRFARKTDAQAWLDAQVSTVVQGSHVAPSAGKELIADAGDRWLKVQAHLKQTTTSTREYTWTAHVKPRWGRDSLKDVRKSAVQSWIAEMVAADVGVPTIENAVGILRMILESAVEDRQIALNPCASVKLPRRMHKPRGYLTHTQVDQLAHEVAEHATAVRFLAYTGLRWGEMAALRVSNFDMLRRRVNVIEAVAEVRGKLVWSTAKDHERRSVPFPEFLANDLAALMTGRNRDSLVFRSDRGKTLRVSTYRPRVFMPAVRRLQAAATKARAEELASGKGLRTPEFPTVTPHDLRHTAASLAISAGANVKAVQTMLGHKSAALTLDTYADLFPDDLEAVAEALDAAVRALRTAY